MKRGRRPSEWRLIVGLGAAAFIVVAAFVFAVWSGAWERKFRAEASQARDLKSDIEGALSDVERYRAEVRGYLLSPGDKFVEAMGRRREHSLARLERLRKFAGTDPAQRARVELVAALVDSTLAQGVAVVEHRRRGELSLDAVGPAVAEGERLLDEVRAAVDDLRAADEEDSLRRDAAITRFRNRNGLIYTGLQFAVVVILVVLGWAIVRQTRVRRRVEAELAERERLLRAIIEGTTDAIRVADVDGRIQMVNSAAARLFGREPGELVGSAYEEAVPSDMASFMRGSDQRIMESGLPDTYEHDTTIGGATRTWLSTKGPLRDSDGSITGVFVISRDITQRKAAELSLRALNADLTRRSQEAEAANKELEAFSYSVSHDLRAPLRHVAGFVDLLSRRIAGTLDPTSQRYLETITDAAGRMGQLIDDLLAFSRMGRSEMKWRRVELGALAKSVSAEIDARTQGRRVEWRIGELPDVDGDEAMLRMALANLFDNAAKYTSKRETAVVEVQATKGDGHVDISVRDNGVGFDMAYVDRLFGVFQRLHRAEEFEGTGIGLANVRRIVTRHGGTTWAEGRPGEGATFFIRLPS